MDFQTDSSKLWSLALEFTEKLDKNREILSNLRKQAEELKISAKEIGSCYKVRRYNVDLSKESFESELERTNTALVLENHALSYENRQLDSLLKEYEQSLQTIMAKVRHHAQISSQHETSLHKHYEALLAAQDTQHTSIVDPTSEENFQHSLTKLRNLIHLALYTQHQPVLSEDEGDTGSISPLGSTSLEDQLNKLGINPDLPLVSPPFTPPLSDSDAPNAPISKPADTTTSAPPSAATTSFSAPAPAPLPRNDWATEREIEISRLTHENSLIRTYLSIHPHPKSPSSPHTPTEEYGQGRSIYGEENAGTLKRMMHAKRGSIVSSPGNHQFGGGGIVGGGGGILGGNGMDSPTGSSPSMGNLPNLPTNLLNTNPNPMRTFRSDSPPGPTPNTPPPDQTPLVPNYSGGNGNVAKPPPRVDSSIRKPPPLRGLSSVRPSSPLGLYRNISLPSTSVSTETARK